MLGVVIWSAEVDSKAIIWCEDHGELAFLGQSQHSAACTERFDEGDLIQFDIEEFSNLRFAQNPRKIAQHYCSDLSSVLETAQVIKERIESEKRGSISDSENVVSLAREKELRELSAQDAAAG
ncbi:hypothetical protein [Planktotalea sp.]|uniref:hypothetical protein n=1 Tax=Planktotalea sp. TaxID=2029877 RepID=UPI003D6A175A